MPAHLQYDEPPAPRSVAPLVHPFEILRQGVDGSATVSVLIDPLGRVHETHIAQASEPAFGLALQASMQAWSFVPAGRGGAPTRALVTFRQSFGWQSRDGSTSRSAVAILDRLKDLDKAPEHSNAESAFVPVEKLDAVPKPFYQPKPAYPAVWAEKGLAGSVEVEFFIDAEGVTQLPRIVSARQPELGWAAVTAVARWQFEPPMRQGERVITRARMTFEFRPPPEAKRG